ncbi:MAG: glycoside hydrolase family 2 TIM barrel-domain containing protein [Rikenellaceae bacterium]
MRRINLLSAISAIMLLSPMSMAATTPDGYPITQRTKIEINDNWRFKLGGADEANYTTSLDDSKWESVSIPHTLKLTSIDLDGCRDDKKQTTFHREVGWYRRDITPSKSSKRVVLDFEGVHQVTTLWVNGRKVGVHGVGGYTPFQFDITPYVKRGVKNQITVLADNRVSQVAPPDPGMFDYVKFSGLYRDVYLVETSQMHITSNLESMESGVTITTPSVDYVNGNATIDIRTEIRNESKKSESATLIQRVVDAEGNVVLKMEQNATIPAGGSHRFAQIGGIEDDVKFWSPDSPYLYMVNTVLVNSAGEKIDVVDNRLGLRKIEYNHERGFIINGKETEIIGFNRHQHYPYIGDALPNSLHYRDMLQFKAFGFNCVRTAHYPQDDELLKACDELGILVYEEAPTWISISDKKEWFANLADAARAMIRNHKNHPSVFIWGAGINHRGPVPEVQFVIKQEDPTRLTASQSSRWTGWQTSGWTDIFANMNYGPGIWEREEPLFAMEGKSGPEVIAQYKRDPMMPGMISWTAHAYYTFHDIGNWENRMRSGNLDGFRYPRQELTLWYPSELLSTPYIHMANDWTDESRELTIYSNADYIEIFQEGAKSGRFYPSQNLIYKGLDAAPYIIKNLPYRSNELVIKGYRDGLEIFTKSYFTPEKATSLRLFADDMGIAMRADGSDIMVVHAEVVDANGTRLRDYEGEISFTVEGDATIVGDKSDARTNPVPVALGKGSALIKSGTKAGKITVTASSTRLKGGSVSFESVDHCRDMVAANAYPIYDRETMLVDMGGDGQLVQFGWTAWNVADQQNTPISIKQNKLGNYAAGDTPAIADVAEIVDPSTAGAYTLSIKPRAKDAVLRWLGEMNVIGRDGFVYGDGVLVISKDGFDLCIEGLTEGDYKLKSYHHAPASNTNDMDPNLERLTKERIHTLPYSKSIEVSVNGKVQDCGVVVSSGKSQQYGGAANSFAEFTVDAKSKGKATIHFNSKDQNTGIWLNGFELVREL